MRHGLLQLRHQTLAQRGARGLKRQRCGDGDFVGQFQGLRADIRLGHQQIGQADLHGFLAVDASSREKQQIGLLDADQTRQRDRQTKPGVESQSVEVG